MHGDDPNDAVGNHKAVEPSSSAETKRRAARRRFLAKGTAAGSGVLIVTLYHQRGFAKKGEKITVSSPEQCLSLGGTLTGHEKEVKDSVTGKKIKRLECEI